MANGCDGLALKIGRPIGGSLRTTKYIREKLKFENGVLDNDWNETHDIENFNPLANLTDQTISEENDSWN